MKALTFASTHGTTITVPLLASYRVSVAGVVIAGDKLGASLVRRARKGKRR